MYETLDALYPAHLASLRQRTDSALAAAGLDALAIYAGRASYQFLDDRPYPFAVNPHFKHWVPVLDAPDSWVLYVPGQRPRLCIHQPADYWHAPPRVPDAPWTRQFDLHVLGTAADARPLIETGSARVAFIGEMQPEFATWGFASVNPPALLDPLHYARALKTPYELQCMREASRVAARAHLAAHDAWQGGASEFETHAAYCAAARQSPEELPYGSIVAFDTHAAVLHYQHLDRHRPAQRRSFLIDAGMGFRGYAADITRTYASASGEFSALIDAMESEQLAMCDGIRADTDYRDVHLDAHRRIATVLRDAGIISLAADAAVESGLSGVFFPHGIGHLLGLQVHDVAGLAAGPAGGELARPVGHPYLRLTRRLEPGCVVTVEPGLYFIDLLLEQARSAPHAAHIDWDAVERLRPYGGIRIEDDVVCTSGAPENLTRAAFAACA